MSGGCNSCKYLNPKGKKPGRTSGYLFQCGATGKWVNAAKDSCDSYVLDEGRTSFEVNEIYQDSYYYNDMKNDAGCNSCMNLDPKSKKPGKNSGALYFCKVKGNYVSGADDACEKYANGYRDNREDNEIYEDGKNYSDNAPRGGSFSLIIVLVIVLAIIYFVSIFMR